MFRGGAAEIRMKISSGISREITGLVPKQIYAEIRK